MSISNHSVNVKASTEDLEELLEDYQASYDRIMDLPDDEIDDSQLEWLESGIEIIESELARREDGQDHHYDTPSLEDRGLSLGSYAS